MTRDLSPEHQHQLEVASGIPDALIDQRGYYTATTKAELARLGFAASQQLVPALVIPMFGVDGDIKTYQVKPDEPRLKDGKPVKYETPAGGTICLDVHPAMRDKLSDPRTPLWITEGVKKGDAATARGLLTIALIGVFGWRTKTGELPDWDRIALKGRTIYLAFDSDVMQKVEVRQALARLQAMLERRGASVRVLLIPTPDGRKVGLDDYFVAGGTINDLLSTALSKVPYVTVTDDADAPSPFPFTELGVAERFIKDRGKDIRWCPSFGRWLTWSGRHWILDELGGAPVARFLHETVRDLGREAQNIKDDDVRKAAIKFALRIEDHNPLSHIMAIAKTLPGVAIAPDDLDRNNNLINVGNGTIDLTTFEMRDHRREDNITSLIDIPYDPEAECPRWESFLDVILQGESSLLRYLWKACGYSLTGEVGEKCFFFLHGAGGDNGKSVFIRTMHAILGGYARSTPTETLLAKFGGPGIPNDVATLKGSRFVSASEAGENKRLNEELIKEITGGDPINARFMRGEWFTFPPTFKIWMTGNYKPVIKGQDPAIWRRVKLIPFTYSVPKEDQDPHLDAKLAKEFPGILRWLIEGCMAWREEGLQDVSAIADHVKEYREDMDELGEFLTDRLVFSSAASVPALTLYKAYEKWASANGMKAMTNTAFGRKLAARGVQKQRSNAGIYYVGVMIADDDTQGATYRGGE